MSTLALLLIAATMLAGLVGVLLPVIPGLVLVWAAALVWVLNVEGSLRWVVLAVLTLIALLGASAKYLLSGRAAAASGVPTSTLLAGVAGAVVGFFVIPVLGLIIGGILGVLLAEWARHREWGTAWRSTGAVVRGFGIGVALELLAGITMVGIWAVAAFFSR